MRSLAVKKHKYRYNFNPTLSFIGVLIFLFLLVAYLLKIQGKFHYKSTATDKCRCINDVWIGTVCPNWMVNKSCRSGKSVKSRQTTATPIPTINSEPTLPPIKIPTKPLKLFR